MKPIIHKYNYVRSKIYTDSAKDQSCTICGTNVGTTVFVHLDEQWAGKGTGIKADDIAGFDGCDLCHMRYAGILPGERIPEWKITRAMYRTLKNRIERGIVTVKGYEP